MKIYDLKIEQNELLDLLFWMDPEDEESEIIKRKLAQIEGSIERKLSFLSDVLAESIALSQIATERKKIAMDRLNRKEAQTQRAEEKLRQFILSVMHDFNISKVQGDLLNISKYERDAIIQTSDFDIDKLANIFVKVTKTLDKKAINEEIKNGNSVVGFEVVKKETLRVS